MLVLLGLWIAMAVAWGWAAAAGFGFFLVLAALFSAAAGMWGEILTRSGERHYDRLLNGPRRK